MYINIISTSFDVSTIQSTCAYPDFNNDRRIKAGYIKLSPNAIIRATGFQLFGDDFNSQIPAIAYGSTPGKSSVCQISSLRKSNSGTYPCHLDG